MKIVWDLDGVLRDLSGYISHKYSVPYPRTWNSTFADGKNIYETINDDLDILLKAPPTAFLKVSKEHFDKPEVWTSQPKAWRPNTIAWLDKYIGAYEVRFLKCKEKAERLESLEDTILVEDNPSFKSYDRIILIDRPYNQEVQSAMRIFGTKHLDNLLTVLKGA